MAIIQSSTNALVLAPPFWPNLPPLSLVHISSYLLAQGQSISLFDLNNKFYNLADEKLKKAWMVSSNIQLEENMPDILNKDFEKETEASLKELSGFDAIGFSCYASNLKTTLYLARRLKQENPYVKIALGGPEITRHYFKNKKLLETEEFAVADLIAVGEGEKPFYDFVTGASSQQIVSFEEINDLNAYNPISAYSLLNINDYPRKNAVSLLLSRGCLKICRFCSERLLYKKQRIRSIDNIIKEIDFHLKGNAGRYFVFHDSMLNMNLARLERLCDAIIKKFGRINWEAQMGIRPEMSDALLGKVAQSGCYNLFIGLESGSDNTLANMRKGFTSLEALMFFKKLKKAKLSFGVSLIVGYPGETEEDFHQSLRFLVDNQEYIPKIEQINPFVYYEGTDTHPEDGYLKNKTTLDRTNRFVQELQQHNFKMTKAFINNLVAKHL